MLTQSYAVSFSNYANLYSNIIFSETTLYGNLLKWLHATISLFNLHNLKKQRLGDKRDIKDINLMYFQLLSFYSLQQIQDYSWNYTLI